MPIFGIIFVLHYPKLYLAFFGMYITTSKKQIAKKSSTARARGPWSTRSSRWGGRPAFGGWRPLKHEEFQFFWWFPTLLILFQITQKNSPQFLIFLYDYSNSTFSRCFSLSGDERGRAPRLESGSGRGSRGARGGWYWRTIKLNPYFCYMFPLWAFSSHSSVQICPISISPI